MYKIRASGCISEKYCTVTSIFVDPHYEISFSVIYEQNQHTETRLRQATPHLIGLYFTVSSVCDSQLNPFNK